MKTLFATLLLLAAPVLADTPTGAALRQSQFRARQAAAAAAAGAPPAVPVSCQIASISAVPATAGKPIACPPGFSASTITVRDGAISVAVPVCCPAK